MQRATVTAAAAVPRARGKAAMLLEPPADPSLKLGCRAARAGALLREGTAEVFEVAPSTHSCRCEARRQPLGAVSLLQSFRELPGDIIQPGGSTWVQGRWGHRSRNPPQSLFLPGYLG